VGISVPAASAPAAGYPVLIFAHGTGGSFAEQFAKTGFAQVVATGSVPSVLVAIDLPEHGDRRGASSQSPETLFYNFLNPRAARDNVVQGAADLMSLVRWVKQGGLGASESPTASAIVFDPAHIALMGHSQGATHSALMAPYEPDLQGVVLSGNGGHLASSLLTKKNPIDVASVLPVALLDPDMNGKLVGGGYNPALALVQMVFDRADPLNYAHRLQRDPSAEAPTGQHVFVTYGLGDTYATEDTQDAYARAARLTMVKPVLKDLHLPQADPPLSENETIGAAARTVGLRQYAPKGNSDGHFVAVDPDQDGRADVERFLDQLLAGKPPAIGN
jgi:pimeloyl-ACP methyl ester carboxylesterase